MAPKIGSTIRSTNGCPPYFRTGAIGILVSLIGDYWWADFGTDGSGDGHWCAGPPEDFDVIEEPTDSPETL
jgi:hypothetical protein